MEGAFSKVEVERVGGRSRLTSCLSIAPLKILTPDSEADYSTVVLSGYGGGLVAGDSVRLDIRCGREAKLFLGTQAFTKVYKSTDGQVAHQEIAGHIEPGGCVVALPDPVVPYAKSVFVQNQVWRLREGAVLVLLDGGTAGRGERGERFQYSSYTSNITVYREGELLLVERFDSQPDLQTAERIGGFGEYAAFANAFIIATPESTAYGACKEALSEALAPRLAGQLTESPDGELMVSLAEARPGLLVLRSLGRVHQSLDEVMRALTQMASLPEILDSNPLHRKY